MKKSDISKIRLMAILSVIIAGLIVGYALMTPPPSGVLPEPDIMLLIWEDGQEQSIADEYSLGEERELARFLLQVLQKVNLQGRCILSDEQIQEMKKNGRVVEMIFRPVVWADITISQWVEPRDRNYIPTDKDGYRVLEDVESVLFILEDNSDEGWEGHIFMVADDGVWSCWAIQQENGEIDTSWIIEFLHRLSARAEPRPLEHASFTDFTKALVSIYL